MAARPGVRNRSGWCCPGRRPPAIGIAEICELADDSLFVNLCIVGYFKRGQKPEQPSWSSHPHTKEWGDWTWAFKTQGWLGTYVVRSTDAGELQDGRYLMIYGYRRPPYGVRGCISEDGLTWDIKNEFVIRDGGVPGKSDVGSPGSSGMTPVSSFKGQGSFISNVRVRHKAAGGPVSHADYR